MIKVNWLLLFLVFAVIMFNLPFFDPLFIPVHDTMYQFSLFHLYYSEWLFNHDVVAWLPYSTYGVPALFYQLHVFTPFDYFVMAVGKVFAIKNAMVLFKVGMLLAQCFFAYGVYKLASLLFKSRMTVFLVGLSAIGSVVWYTNVHVDFRFYSGFPIVAYWMIRFYQERDGRYLSYAGLWGLVFWVIGCNPYHCIIWTLVSIVMMIVLHVQMKMTLKDYVRAFQNKLVYLLPCLAMVLFFVACFTFSMRELVFDTPGRDMHNAYTSNISIYLNYGGHIDWIAILKGFFLTRPIFSPQIGSTIDLVFYAGIMVPIFAIYAFIKVREKYFYLFAILMVVFLTMSFGGYFARLVALIPGVLFYRHLAFLLVFVKLFLIICAGFGFDHFWRTSEKYRWLTILWIFVVSFILLQRADDWLINMGLHWSLGLQGLVYWLGHFAKTIYFVLIFTTIVAILVFTIFLLCCCIKSVSKNVYGASLNYWKIAVLLLILFDLILFQNQVYLGAPVIDGPMPSQKIFDARPIHYQNHRLMATDLSEYSEGLRLLNISSKSAVYTTNYNFLQLDLCEVPGRQDLKTRLVYNSNLHKACDAVWRGCQTPKLQIQEKVDGIRDDQSFKSQSIEVLKFNTNELVAKIDSPVAGYLLYADAMHSFWRATVNQKMTPIKPANTAFKSVAIPAGKSIVHFFIDPKIVAVSTILAIIGLVSAVYFLVLLGSEIVRVKEK